jgi:hypothetical protein
VAPAPDTGDVRADVTLLLSAFVAVLTQPPFTRLFAAFMDAA